MKKIVLLLLAFMLAAPSVSAGEARFSLITCAPGNEAYSLFGHTALRYVDEDRGVDKVYNYGYFSFDAPNFAWRFILGQTDYLVASVPYEYFLPEYAERGSEVVEQVLNLSPVQTARLYRLLEENCRVQNRVYRYNYFYANCTTKARDKFIESLGEGCSIVYGDSAGATPTLREALAVMTAPHPWYSFGIDLLLGSDVDEPASLELLQFIPANLMNNLEKALLTDADGNSVPAVKETNILLHGNMPVAARNNFTPFNASLLFLLFTFIVMLCELRKKKTYWGYDVFIMTIQGLGGCLLLFMALCSEHPAVDANYAMLLINPLSLVLMPFMLFAIIKHKSLHIAWVQVAFVVLFFLSAIFGLQHYPAPLYFCAVAILSRLLFHIYKKRICELDIV